MSEEPEMSEELPETPETLEADELGAEEPVDIDPPPFPEPPVEPAEVPIEEEQVESQVIESAQTPVIQNQLPETKQLMTPTSGELEAAKWYTIGFLVVSGLFAVVGFGLMIYFTIHLIGIATR